MNGVRKREHYETSIIVKEISLLQGVDSFTKLCDQIVRIRQIFQFSSTVRIQQVNRKHDIEILVGGKVPDWVIGLSAGRQIWILKESQWKHQDMNLRELILHEFVHIACNQSLKRELPLWINEGLAVYFSGQYKSFKLKNFKINYDMNFYDLSYEDENLYCISILLIRAFIQEYGETTLIEELKQNNAIEESVLLNNENLKRILINNREDLLI